MLWVILALSAAIIYAAIVMIDKFLMDKAVKEPAIPLLFFGVVGLTLAAVIFLIRGFGNLSLLHIAMALLAGVLAQGCTYFYYKALRVEEASRVGPLYALAPLYVLFLATIFLGEIFTILRYVGIFLIVAGALLISMRKLSLRFNRAFWFMQLCVLLGSLSVIIIKYLLGFHDYWIVFAYGQSGLFFGTIPLFFVSIKKLTALVRKQGTKLVALLVIGSLGNKLSYFLSVVAMSIGFVTLVTSLTATEPFFILLFSIILSMFFPKILKEEITKGIFFQKLIAIILLFVGAVLII